MHRAVTFSELIATLQDRGLSDREIVRGVLDILEPMGMFAFDGPRHRPRAMHRGFSAGGSWAPSEPALTRSFPEPRRPSLRAPRHRTACG